MRIEVLVGLENPEFYPIKKPKTIIGSDLACDIVVTEDEISRKHLIVAQEGDQYLVIDQGSTNGSYLNEERLVPGRRVEFTSYFPVRLGSSVLISLVSDEEAADETEKISIPFPGESSAPKTSPLKSSNRASSDKTTVRSLKDLQGSSTKSLVRQRQEYKKKVEARAKAAPDKKKKKKKKKGFKLEFIHVVVMLILGPAVYFTFTGEEEQVIVSPTATRPGNSNPKAPSVVVEPAKPALPKAPSFLEIFELHRQAPKCSTKEEVILCHAIKGAKDSPWGVATYKEDTLVVMIDGTPYYEAMKNRLPPPGQENAASTSGGSGSTPPHSRPEAPAEQVATGPAAPAPVEEAAVKVELTPEQEKAYNEELWELATGKFLLDGFETNDYLKITRKKIVIAFFTLQYGIPAVSASFAITPESLSIVRRLVASGRFNYVPVSRAKIMGFRKQYYELNL